MTMIPCSSSLVNGYEYRPATRELVLDLKGKLYVYGDVPAAAYAAFHASPSKGTAYQTIKRGYGVTSAPQSDVGKLGPAELVKLVNMNPVERAAYLAAPAAVTAPRRTRKSTAGTKAASVVAVAPVAAAEQRSVWRPPSWNASVSWGDPNC